MAQYQLSRAVVSNWSQEYDCRNSRSSVVSSSTDQDWEIIKRNNEAQLESLSYEARRCDGLTSDCRTVVLGTSNGTISEEGEGYLHALALFACYSMENADVH